MDDVTRKAVERRAFALWEAGRPEGSALLYWLRAELELGVIRKVEADDPFLILHDLAVAARQNEDVVGALHRLLDKGIARPGATTFLGGDGLARSTGPKEKGDRSRPEGIAQSKNAPNL